MSFILTRVQIGQQGVLPGELLMESTDDLATITMPGYLNVHDGVLPTDIITAVYGTPLVNKQQFNPVFSGGIITLAVIGGGGSINGAINLGAGNGLLGVSGADITGKSLIAGANITLTPTATDITIAATGAGGGTITDGANIGVGQGHVFSAAVGTDLQFKTLVQGSNVVITENSSSVTIAAIPPAFSGITALENIGTGVGVWDSTVSGVAKLNSIEAGAGISISEGGGNITITNTGGGGGGFEYQDAQWVAQNGNDANDGKSINTPKLTVQSSITALAGSGVINIVDDGSYSGAWNIPNNADITINAPAAFLNTTGVTLGTSCIFKVNSYSFGTNFNNLFPAAANNGSVYINAQKVRGNIGNGTNNPPQLFIDAQEITGDYSFGANLTAIIKFDSIAGDIVDTSPSASSFSIGIFGRSQTGNISSTNTKIYGQLQISSGSPSITGIKQGYFNGIYYGDQENTGTWFNDGSINGQPLNIINWNTAQTVNLTAANYRTYSNAFIFYTGNNGYGRFNLTDDAGIPVGFQVWMFQVNDGNQTGAQATYSANPIISTGTMSSQVAYTRTGGSWIKYVKVTQAPNSQWAAFGDIFNSASLTVTNIYISQVLGTDNPATTGSIDSQFATINAALTYLISNFTATPANGINLVITDDAIYNEKLNFTGTSNINLIGRTALINYTSAGIGDNAFTSDAPQQLVSVGGLQVTGGGDCLDYSGTGALVLNVDILGGGNINNNGIGFIFAQTYAIQGTTSNTGGGQFRYTCILRSGTDGAAVIGTSAEGASDNWTVRNNINSSLGNIVADTGEVQAIQGNIRAGSNGQSGQFISYPSVAASGYLNIEASANGANAITTLSNQVTSIPSKHSLPNTAFSDLTLLVSRLTQIDPMSNIIYFDTNVTAAILAGGASFSLISTFFGGQYRVRDLRINLNGTNFSGGGGDRNLAITDGTTVYSVIPAANLQALSNSLWGSVALPPPASADWSTLTQPAVNLFVVYSGGTTDYAAGSITITGAWEKVI